MNLYLIWSNEHGAWWRPNSCGYTGDMWEAGRYTKEKATDVCQKAANGWRDGTLPPEVTVPAPENDQTEFTVAEICAMRHLTALRVEEATLAAIVERATRDTTGRPA